MVAKLLTILRSSPRKRGSRADMSRPCNVVLDSRFRGNERSEWQSRPAHSVVMRGQPGPADGRPGCKLDPRIHDEAHPGKTFPARPRESGDPGQLAARHEIVVLDPRFRGNDRNILRRLCTAVSHGAGGR